jgi:2-polyprenyl-3-methyl-5-hydroxy-6-metoxy-1,4-benzoquinol methylase
MPGGEVREESERLDWREAWQRKRRERVGGSLAGKAEPGDWDRLAQDYAEWNKSDDYEYGRKAIEAIREIIKPDFEALDIGAGTGALTIPLTKVVRRVTAVEPSEEMVRRLMKDVEERGIRKIKVINKSWQEVDDAAIREKFDIVACSHLLWQFEDVDKQLKRMENASRRYCCVVHPAGERDIIIENLWSEVTGKKYSGELDPDLDDLIFIMLRQRGILVNVKVINYTVRVSVEQEVKHIESLLSRYGGITPALRDVIKKRVVEKSLKGVYETESNAAVMWWEAPTRFQ